MKLSIPQIARMSRLLDEALPLDNEARSAWLDALPAEHQDLAPSLRRALLPSGAAISAADSVAALPKFAVEREGGAPILGVRQPGLRVGPYELIRALGAGGMAEVWLARRADGAFKRDLALKLPTQAHLRSGLEERFVRERDILASLEHPHIARLYDAGVDPNGLPYLAMEYVAGQPLLEWCDAHRQGIPARLELFLQVLEAVQYAHDQHVIHRDLKPSNILVTESRQVRLLDFGIAKLLQDETADHDSITNVYGRALTPDYASPEVLRDAPVDARSDIYSLGVLLYELVTGVRPYRVGRAASIGLLEQAVATADVKKPSAQSAPDAVTARATTPGKLTRQLRGDLDGIVLKALAKEPTARYPSADAFARDVRRYLDRRPVEALPARTLDRLKKFVSRNKTLVAVIALALVAVVGTVAEIAWGPGRRARDERWRDLLAEAKMTRLADFAGTAQAAAVSRDGRYAAFLADRDGQIDVWLTAIGTGRFRNLTNGQYHDLTNPSLRTVSFSADGSLVSFWTRTATGSRPDDINLTGAPTLGGPLRIYMRQAGEFDWSPDGSQVVFHTTAPGDPLFVRTGNGEARQIYIAPRGIHCHFPTWSPDGEFIYFVRGDPSAADWDIWRLRPAGSDPERITSHRSRVTYPVLLDAHTLIYLATDIDGSGPWVYGLDVSANRAHRISAGLERYTSLSASADGRRIVATVTNTRSDLWRVAIDGVGPPRHTAVPAATLSPSASSPRFGPGYIAYVSIDGGRRGVWKLTNGERSELWSDPSAERVGAPAIAPDGRHIAFIVDRQDSTQLHVVDSDGRHGAIIPTPVALRGGLAWAPDSKSIIGAAVRDGEPRIARIFLDGSPPQPLESEYSLDPAWSPDGKYFVYSGADIGTTFPLRAAGPDGRPYSVPNLILTRGARRIAFARNSGSLVFLRGEMDHKNFWLLDPRTGAERQLTDLPSNFSIGDFDVSPDGSEVVFDRVQDQSSSVALIERAQ